MALYAPLESTANWYRFDAIFSMELIESFINGVERQAEESTKQYQEQKEIHEVEEHSEYLRVVETHQGLDNETWDLHSIFNDHFPSLQRRSALLTICGQFEYELDNLCNLYQKEKSYKIGLADINGKGIERSTTYLEKVAGLNTNKTTAEWAQIKNINKLRNLIIHQNAKLNDKNGNPNNSAIKYVDETDTLKIDDSEISIKEGFLQHVVDTYKQYYALLNQSILSENDAS